MKENTIIQLDFGDLKKILKQAQVEAMAEAKASIYDKFSNVALSFADICRLHGTCYKTLNEMASAGIIIPDINGKFSAAEVLKWDFAEMKKRLRYAYKVA